MKYLSLIPGYKIIHAPSGIPDIGNRSGLEYIKIMIGKILVLVLIAGVVIALIYLISGGMQWITSQGEKDKIAAARSKLTYAIIGLLVIFLSFAIVAFFGGAFGIDLMSFSF